MRNFLLGAIAIGLTGASTAPSWAQATQPVDGLSPNQFTQIFEDLGASVNLRRAGGFYISSSFEGLEFFILPFRCIDTNPRRSRTDADDLKCTAVRFLAVYRGDVPDLDVINQYNRSHALTRAYASDGRLFLNFDLFLSGANNLVLAEALGSFVDSNESLRAIVASESYDLSIPPPELDPAAYGD